MQILLKSFNSLSTKPNQMHYKRVETQTALLSKRNLTIDVVVLGYIAKQRVYVQGKVNRLFSSYKITYT